MHMLTTLYLVSLSLVSLPLGVSLAVRQTRLPGRLRYVPQRFERRTPSAAS